MDPFQFLFEFTCYTTLSMWSRDNIYVYARRLRVRAHLVPAAGAEPAAVAARPALGHRSPARAAELRGIVRDPRLRRRLPPRARLERLETETFMMFKVHATHVFMCHSGMWSAE